MMVKDELREAMGYYDPDIKVDMEEDTMVVLAAMEAVMVAVDTAAMDPVSAADQVIQVMAVDSEAVTRVKEDSRVDTPEVTKAD